MANKLRDHLTYADLAGRRILRRYVVAALILLGLSFLIFAWAQFQRTQVAAEAPDPPSQLPKGVLESQPDPIPALEGVRASISAPEQVGCPNDTEQWAFAEALPASNYKRIAPTCVYKGLAQTVAWHLLERMGYSKPEAAEMLGLAELPWQPEQTITGLTSTKGPLTIPLTREWPPHPGYRYWVVDTSGRPASTYSLRGCYRTRTIVGNRVEDWATGYPAICVVALDRGPGWAVHELVPHRYSAERSGEASVRTFTLFGYVGKGHWVLLGEHRDLLVPLEDAVRMQEERQHVTEKLGSTPWDPAWLQRTFGWKPRPLPEGWQTFTDPAEIQAIAQELNR